MITRRRALAAAGMLLAAPSAHAQRVQWAEWLGTYAGTARYY